MCIRRADLRSMLLGDGAGAVGDGEGGGLSHSVGLAIVRDLSRLWAVSCQRADGLGEC